MTTPNIQIRVMTHDDIPLGMRLKAQANWNQSEESWRRFLDIAPQSCFVAQDADTAAGLATVAVFQFNHVAWIAMMLVDENTRGCGLGTRMMSHALDYCDQRNIQTVRLDATPMGQPVYAKLNFTPEYPLARYERPATTTPTPAIPTTPATATSDTELQTPTSLEPIIALDHASVGYDRSAMLTALWRQNPSAFRLIPNRGYATFYHGSNATHLGPIIANDTEAGLALLNHTLDRCQSRRLFIDLPLANTTALNWAAAHNFTHQRDLTRMRRGQPITDQPTNFFATAGAEKG